MSVSLKRVSLKNRFKDQRSKLKKLSEIFSHYLLIFLHFIFHKLFKPSKTVNWRFFIVFIGLLVGSLGLVKTKK